MCLRGDFGCLCPAIFVRGLQMMSLFVKSESPISLRKIA